MTATIRMLMKALSPITQGQGTKGNEQIIKREAVMTPLGNVSGSLLANYWRKKDARQAQAAAAKDPVQPACENLSKG